MSKVKYSLLDSSDEEDSEASADESTELAEERRRRYGIEKARSKSISKSIDEDIKLESKTKIFSFRFVIIGQSKSGKSTVMKNLKMHHGSPLSYEEVSIMREEVRQNLNDGLMQVIRAMPVSSPPCELQNPSLQWRVDWLNENDLHDRNVESDEYFDHLKTIWDDQGIKDCFNQSDEFPLKESTGHFLSRVDTISKSNYIPSTQDILYSAQLNEEGKVHFQRKGFNFSIVEAGHKQKTCYGKWMHLYSDMNAIMFVVDCSDYHSKLYKNQSKNCLKDNLALFKEIWQNKAFDTIPVILLLNKQDLLRTKIAAGKQKLASSFPAFADYVAPSGKTEVLRDDDEDYRNAKYFIRDLFLDVAKEDREKKSLGLKGIHPYFTNALDSTSMTAVLKDYKNVLMMVHLASY